jgi:hypothetical protein
VYFKHDDNFEDIKHPKENNPPVALLTERLQVTTLVPIPE